MSNPMIRIHNTETGEIIDREMNAEELKQYKTDQERELKQRAKDEATAATKAAAQAKLAALGLTVEDLTALGL